MYDMRVYLSGVRCQRISQCMVWFSFDSEKGVLRCPMSYFAHDILAKTRFALSIMERAGGKASEWGQADDLPVPWGQPQQRPRLPFEVRHGGHNLRRR